MESSHHGARLGNVRKEEDDDNRGTELRNEGVYLEERPVAFNAGKLVAGTRRAFQPTASLAGGQPKA